MKRMLYLLLLAATVVRADSPYPAQSIYQLQVQLTNQSDAAHGLDVYSGHPVLITMFYGSCPAACPLLIDTLRAVERATSTTQRARLRVMMISIDPEHDTVENLRTLAEARHIDLSRWTLARTDAATARKIAAVLSVQYRRLPEGGFNHSSVISLLTAEGEIALQSTLPGKADPSILAELSQLRDR